jgi:hypothetical protein
MPRTRSWTGPGATTIFFSGAGEIRAASVWGHSAQAQQRATRRFFNWPLGRPVGPSATAAATVPFVRVRFPSHPGRLAGRPHGHVLPPPPGRPRPRHVAVLDSVPCRREIFVSAASSRARRASCLAWPSTATPSSLAATGGRRSTTTMCARGGPGRRREIRARGGDATRGDWWVGEEFRRVSLTDRMTGASNLCRCRTAAFSFPTLSLHTHISGIDFEFYYVNSIDCEIKYCFAHLSKESAAVSLTPALVCVHVTERSD